MRTKVAAVLGILLVCGGLNASQKSTLVPQNAEEVLDRAYASVGGSSRLRAVDRLRISLDEKQTLQPDTARARVYKVWLPGRFQNILPGLVTHTLVDGKLSFDREVSAEVRSNAEQSIPGVFRFVTLTFLLRAPDLGPPKFVGAQTIDGLSGFVVEFPKTGRDEGRPIRMLFDKETGLPRAVITSSRPFGSTGQFVDQVRRLDDYREVGGVKFPHKITLQHPQNPIIAQIQKIEVNPTFTAKDFSR